MVCSLSVIYIVSYQEHFFDCWFVRVPSPATTTNLRIAGYTGVERIARRVFDNLPDHISFLKSRLFVQVFLLDQLLREPVDESFAIREDFLLALLGYILDRRVSFLHREACEVQRRHLLFLIQAE